MSMFYGFLALCLFAGISGNLRVRRNDDCEIETASNFNQTKYTGRWYEYGNYRGSFLLNMKCWILDWTTTTNGNIIVTNTYILYDNNKDQLYKYSYNAYTPDLSKPERFLLRHVENSWIPAWNYSILYTDYTSYAVAYTCSNAGYKIAWIRTRQRNPPKSVVDEAMKIAEKYGFTMSQYTQNNQSSCDTTDTSKV